MKTLLRAKPFVRGLKGQTLVLTNETTGKVVFYAPALPLEDPINAAVHTTSKSAKQLWIEIDSRK